VDRRSARTSGKPIPLNLFGMSFGLTGLAGVWAAMAGYGRAPAGAADALFAIGTLAWLGVLIGYLAHALPARTLVADLTVSAAAPFASLAVIVPMVLAAEGVYPHSPSFGRPLFDVFLALTVLCGSWFTGQWIYGTTSLDAFHPGYFLPTVAGGLLGSAGAAEVGQHRLAEIMFGYGMVCWLILGSLIMGRLLFRPMLPAALVPTLAIEVAPAAVASLAYFALHGDRIDAVVAGIGGYGVLMVLAQLRLVPMYLRLHFLPSTWAFTFSWAAVAPATIHWLDTGRPAGYRTYEYVVLALITLFITSIAIRTIIAMYRHTFVAAPATAPGTALAAAPIPANSLDSATPATTR
jgi:tellurite resistance protein